MSDFTAPLPEISGSSKTIAFPKLDANDLAALRPLATSCSFEDGQTIFRAGDPDLDLFVVESGSIERLPHSGIPSSTGHMGIGIGVGFGMLIPIEASASTTAAGLIAQSRSAVVIPPPPNDGHPFASARAI
jgi:hypothetical protein